MIFLHHYPASLFSEKVRALLGHLKLPWQSVEIPPIMPRPLLMPLSGGYRRTPVLQIGANVYCDTQIICKGLARHAENTTLYAQGFAAERTADWADTHLFRATVALNFRPEALGAMMSQMSEEDAAAFAKDRAELSGDAPIVAVAPAAAQALVEQALASLENSLGDGFLFGDSPSIADFAVYHNVWFLKNNPVNAGISANFKGVEAWYERMAEFGHGDVTESDGSRALAHAGSTDPDLPALDFPENAAFALGQTVSVTPTDYGRIPVTGKLVAMSYEEVVLERETPETGRVFTHFPQSGFEVAAAD